MRTPRSRAARWALGPVAALALAACPGRYPQPDALAADARDAADVVAHTGVASGTRFCGLGGSSPSGVSVPPGFCARTFARVQHARVMRFAPGGELFVASPNGITSGYGEAGPEPARIALVADDDGDGAGDGAVTFLPGVERCHALLFADGMFYYSIGTQVLRMPYTPGQRAPGPAVVIANLSEGASVTHWPRTIDRADDGTLYVSRGGDESATCPSQRPVRGAIVALDGTLQGRVVARGLRNPMYLRCQRGRGRCWANELTGDFWDTLGGVEKLIPIHAGDDWGYPCCIVWGVPIPGGAEACTDITRADHTYPLHDTPFGLDFEPGVWPAPWSHAIFVALHGAFVTWAGTRVVAVATDTLTGEPVAGSAPMDFATGWDDGQRAHGRPADVTFAPDGRLFVANDITGEIFWVAPESLRAP